MRLLVPTIVGILCSNTGFYGGVGLNRFGFRWLVAEDRMRACGVQSVATAGGEVYRRVGIIDEVCIGNVVVKDVSAQVSPIPIIGLDCLRRFTITLDFPGQRVFLDRNSLPDRPLPLQLPDPEMDIVEDGPVFRVNGIAPLSAAILAGVELDDRLLSIDGMETAGMDLTAIEQRLREGRVPKSLVVERNCKRIDLVIRPLGEQKGVTPGSGLIIDD